MKKFSNNSLLKKFSVLRIANLIIILAIFLSSSLFIPNFNNSTEIDRNLSDLSQTPLLADIDSVLFEGTEISLNITDYGNLYSYDQEVSLTNQEEVNLTYYLDDVHGWKVNKVQTSISNIQDTRNWITSSDFEHFNLSSYKVNQVYESDHNYGNSEDKGSSLETFNVPGAIAIRLHFDTFEFEDNYDFFIIEDENNTRVYQDTDFQYDFFSPWVRGDDIQFYMETDLTTKEWGYYIDYYEYLTGNSTISPWQEDSNALIQTYYGYGFIGNSSAMSISLLGDIDPSDTYWVDYYDNEYELLYQDLSVPRGAVVDASFSFDYYAQEAINTNDFTIFAAINGQKIYSLGFADVVSLGRKTWHSTGNININLWVNSTQLFNPIINNQQLNFSLGIKTGNGASYGGYEDRYQQIFSFDNISLILTTIANSTQNDINLKIEGGVLNQGNEWGSSNKTFTNLWEKNPIILKANTTSPSLSFDIDTTLYGYHEVKSRVGQTTIQGVNYQILENGSIFWEFYHNLYLPNQYSDNEFIIDKPKNWEIISVLDPTFLPVSYEGGNVGDDYIFLNKSSASYPGWWKFVATSPNFIQEENVETSKNNQWGLTEFQTGNIGQIKAQINYSSEIPKDLDQTFANLTIYNPEGAIWFEDSAVPLANGTVLFSSFNIAAQNSTGGIHNFTIFWGNGTSVGGLKSNFLITHDSYITLLRPDDAKLDNSTGGSVGDIIPLRIYLRDSENDNPISNAILSFNWTSGPVYMVEIGLGLYDAIIDTSDLGALGLYTIDVSSYKIGFGNSTFNLEINLGEDTVLQRLGSDSSIVINQNSTITFHYYSEVDDEGITGATITVNITNPMYYSVTETTTPGTYSILINTVFLDSTGTYQLIFDFSAPGYEPQTHIYQFNIVNPPPPGGSNPYLQLIIIISIAVIAVLGALSIRSYVILPRKRRKEADLLSRTQRFKDIENIQAVVAIHRDSGIPLYAKTYSILEKHKKEIFSGFIQAIITVGEEMVGNKEDSEELVKIDEEDRSRTILELDFKYFYCLICDRQDLRIIFILTERASDRLKRQISDLSLGAMLELSEQIGNWDGAIHEFEVRFPPIINNYVELYLKEAFIINSADFIGKLRKEGDLNSMETRILNTVYSIAKSKREFHLKTIFEIIHEKNRDIVIDGIETLIKKQIIIPSI